MRCLVTGGAGFIGSNLVKTLLSENAEVVVFDNFQTGKRENIKDILSKIKLIEADLRHYDNVLSACKDVDVIFHEGALPSVVRSVQCPQETNDCNITGTLHVLRAAHASKVKRLVFASSSSIYGDAPTLPKHEEMTPSPLSPYALSKLAGEHYCSIFNNLLGVETVALRYFNVFGPFQDPESEYAAVIPKFISKMVKGEMPVIYGDGEQSRDFTYVADVVNANIKAAKAGKEALGKVCNIAGGKRVTVNELVKMLNKVYGKDFKPIYQPKRPGDVLHSLAEVSRAEKLLGFKTAVSLETGLEKTVKWFQEQK